MTPIALAPRTWRKSLWAAAAWIALTAAAGGVTYLQQRRVLRAAKVQELTFVADLQQTWLFNWLKDELSGVKIHGERFRLAQELDRWRRTPTNADIGRGLRKELEGIRLAYGLRTAGFLDLEGRPLLSAGPLTALSSSDVQRLLASDDAVMSDLHWAGGPAERYLEIGFAAPLRMLHDGEWRNVAILYMGVDPNTQLYPLLQTLPLNSATTEVVLARREEEEVVFLNPLRRRKDAPLRLRSPVATDPAAGQAVAGLEGVCTALDYASVPVLAATRSIPGSPWGIVIRIALTEVDAPAWQLALVVSGLVGMTLIGAGAIAELQSRRQKALALAHEMSTASAYSRSLIEASPDPLVTINADGKITDVNEATVKVTGTPRHDVVGTDFSDYFTEPQKARDGYQHAFASGFVKDYPLTIRNQDGGLRDVLYNASVFRDSSGRVLGVFAAARDVTEQKQAEVALRQANELLEQRVAERTAELTAANQDLESFAYAVAHDLRAPARAICGFTEALAEDLGATPTSEVSTDLEQILLASTRMGALIDGLLTLARCTRGELLRAAIDLSALCTRLFRGLASADPGRTVSWSVEPGLIGYGDGRMLEAVFGNLLENAWKFTSRTAAPAIRVYADRAGSDRADTVFCVADNGAGFDMRHAERLFEPFERLHRQDEFAGIGIGLATVQRIVRRHGGTISATAAVGEGATFRFSLPSGKEGPTPC